MIAEMIVDHHLVDGQGRRIATRGEGLPDELMRRAPHLIPAIAAAADRAGR